MVDNKWDIADILKQVLHREGWPTYTDDAQDRGGPTKGGITLHTLNSWRGKQCSIKDLKNLSIKEALCILERRYVDCNGIHKLVDSHLKAQVIDNAVLSGPYIAVQDLQQSVGTESDGIVGPKTLRAIDDTGVELTVRKLAVVRSLRLARFVQSNPEQLKFLVGWLRRSLGFI